jgi:hypothetical protein
MRQQVVITVEFTSGFDIAFAAERQGEKQNGIAVSQIAAS